MGIDPPKITKMSLKTRFWCEFWYFSDQKGGAMAQRPPKKNTPLPLPPLNFRNLHIKMRYFCNNFQKIFRRRGLRPCTPHYIFKTLFESRNMYHICLLAIAFSAKHSLIENGWDFVVKISLLKARNLVKICQVFHQQRGLLVVRNTLMTVSSHLLKGFVVLKFPQQQQHRFVDRLNTESVENAFTMLPKRYWIFVCLRPWLRWLNWSASPPPTPFYYFESFFPHLPFLLQKSNCVFSLSIKVY